MDRSTSRVAAPVRILPNPVARFYRGGEGISRFRGLPGDDSAPEDWVGSTVQAWDPRFERVGEGLGSVVVDRGPARLVDLVNADPRGWLGEPHVDRAGSCPGILVKLLDTAVRLPVHCHPSRAFAQRVLGSAFGKAECWVILATREETGTVHLGFKHAIPTAALRRWIDDQDVDLLLDALQSLTVRSGDVILVPAGLPHAIGPGIFMVEIQEPTDFSVVAERRGFPIREDDARLGLDWDVMIEAFDRRGLGERELQQLRQVPNVTDALVAGEMTPLTGPDAAAYFRLDRVLSLGTTPVPFDGFGILIVIDGQGHIGAESRRLEAAAGDAFAIPAACAATISVEGDMELLLCRPPEPRLLPDVRDR